MKEEPEPDDEDVFSRNLLLMLIWLNFLGWGTVRWGAAVGPGVVPFDVVPRRGSEAEPEGGEGEIELFTSDPSELFTVSASSALFKDDPRKTDSS